MVEMRRDVMEFFYWYFGIGFCVNMLGCYLHSCAWNKPFAYSLINCASLWLLGMLCWPLGLDVLLHHTGPYSMEEK